MALGILIIAAGGIALAVGHWLYPLGSINHDEQMYVFSARLLGKGHLTLPAGYAPFRPWASGVRAGKLVLKYTPVWPSMLELGAKLGSMRLGSAAAAAASVGLIGVLGRDVFGRWTEGLIAATMLAFSPIFVLQGGTYLPYDFQLVLELAVMLLILSAFRRWRFEDPITRGIAARLVLAGAIWGIACFARPYDALLLVAAISVAAAVAARRQLRRLLAAASWTAIGSAVPIAALLAFNTALMGSPLRNTFTITGPNDQLGFGLRGVFPTSTFNFTPGEGRISLERSLLQLPGWSFGGILLVLLAFLGLWRYRRLGFELHAIVGLGISLAVGYAFFWSPYSIVRLWPGSRTMGPFYHLGLLVPLTLFGAAGLAFIVDRNRALGVVVFALLLVVTLIAIVPELDRNREVTRQYLAVQRMVSNAHLVNAVLFMEDRGANGFESASPFLENRPALDQSVIYALDDGPADLAVADQFPDRTLALMRTELRPGDAMLSPTRFIERLLVKQGPTVSLRFRIVNTTGASSVVSTLHVGPIDRAVVLDTTSSRRKMYDVTWVLRAEALKGVRSNSVHLPASGGTVEIGADLTSTGHPSDQYQRVYPYSVEGGRVRVLAPGRGRYLFRYRNPTWLNQDVGPTLAEAG